MTVTFEFVVAPSMVTVQVRESDDTPVSVVSGAVHFSRAMTRPFLRGMIWNAAQIVRGKLRALARRPGHVTAEGWNAHAVAEELIRLIQIGSRQDRAETRGHTVVHVQERA